MSIIKKILKLFNESLKFIVYQFFAVVKFRAHSHPKVFEWDWEKKGFNRIATVNHLISISGGLEAKYLEIGCASNALFDSVASLNKVGVDPASGGTHRMTSDDFFADNKEIFDVVFIDGLHEYDQVHRDTVNALQSVKVGGYIAFHDFLPATWKEHHVPRISIPWTGDCWKVAVQLMESKGVEFVVLDIDHGVGLIKKLSDKWHVPNITKDLKAAEFDRFVSIADKLPIHSFTDGIAKIIES
jgi:hypothetical protein